MVGVLLGGEQRMETAKQRVKGKRVQSVGQWYRCELVCQYFGEH